MNREFSKLTATQQQAVRFAVEDVREDRNPSSLTLLADGCEVYAYPGANCVNWGVNGPEGFNIARGKLMDGVEL